MFTYATDGNTEKMKEMINLGANIRADDDAAIRYASFFNKWDAVKVLVENGADITADDNLPVKSASENGNFIMTKYLVERGADINSAIKVADESIKAELIQLKNQTSNNVVSRKNDKVLQQAI
jgi:ankyrin repeat protein